MMFVLITSILLLIYFLLFLYYKKGWDLSDMSGPARTPAEGRISVLIPARNEERHLAALLEVLKKQTLDPSLFEVIVINDYSTDRTAEMFADHAGTNMRIITPSVEEEFSSKKKSIEAGVAAATGTWIVTTDADCLPSTNWLTTLYSFARATNASFIAAPVAYTDSSSLLGKFQQIDFAMLQGITAASVTTGFHNMCNGANLLYRRDAFYEVNGFEGIDAVASGDDMLLMHKIWKRNPRGIFYLKDESAIVRTHAIESWRGFMQQRKRWASKTLVYEDKKILFVLFFVYFFNLWFLFLLVYACIHPLYFLVVAGFWVLKFFIETILARPVLSFYKQKRLLPLLFWLQPLHILYTVMTGVLSQLGSYEWKGRKTK